MDTDIELPVAATHHREHLLIERLLKRSPFRLRFPERLETAYREYRDRNAAALFRSSVIYIAYVYAGIGIMASVLAGYDQLGLWPLTFSSFGLLLLLGWLISFTRSFHLYYQRLTSLLAALATMVAVTHPALIGHEEMRILVHIGTVYVMVIIYLALNLRFIHATLAGWGGGLAALGLQMLAGVLGATVGWLIEGDGGCGPAPQTTPEIAALREQLGHAREAAKTLNNLLENIESRVDALEQEEGR